MADDETPMAHKPISPAQLGQPLDLPEHEPLEWTPARLTVLDQDIPADDVDVVGIENAPTRFLKLDEVATELRVSHSTVRRLLESGALPAVQFKKGSPYLIERAELEAFIASSQTTPSVHDIDPWRS